MRIDVFIIWLIVFLSEVAAPQVRIDSERRHLPERSPLIGRSSGHPPLQALWTLLRRNVVSSGSDSLPRYERFDQADPVDFAQLRLQHMLLRASQSAVVVLQSD